MLCCCLIWLCFFFVLSKYKMTLLLWIVHGDEKLFFRCPFWVCWIVEDNLVKSKSIITAEYFLVWYSHFYCVSSRNFIHYFIIFLLFVSCFYFIYKHVIVFFYVIYFSFFFSFLFTLYYCEHLVTFRTTLICLYCVYVFFLVFNNGMHTFD